MKKNVSKKYFDRVAAAVRERGLKLFSRVEISRDGATPRVTELFFHLPRRNLILSLSFRECEGARPRKFWTMRVDLEFADHAQMRGYLCTDDMDAITNRPVSVAGFCRGDWSSRDECKVVWNLSQDYLPNDPCLEPQIFAVAVDDIFWDLKERLKIAPFDTLRMSHWPPTYIFPGCGPLFWRLFVENSEKITRPGYIRTIIEKPIGWQP